MFYTCYLKENYNLSELAHLPHGTDPPARSLDSISTGSTEMKAKTSPWWDFLNEKKKKRYLWRVVKLAGIGRIWPGYQIIYFATFVLTWVALGLFN